MKLSLANQILLSFVLGAAAGLFFGDYCAPLERVGTAFIMLLKMPVLLFMATSLIHAIGSLSASEARRLFSHGVFYYLLFWGVTLATIFCVPMAFPHMDSLPSYGEVVDSASEQHTDLLQLFIPANPVYALSNNLIPAVVVFALFFGYALMKARKKQPLLDSIDNINRVLIRITRSVTLLSPIGVFALIAATVGSISVSHLERIEIYLLAYLGTVVLASFWIFPTLVSCLTDISRRDLVTALRPALVLGFVTGNNLVALPYLLTGLEELSAKKGIDERKAQGTLGSMIPISYNFPTAGNLLTILFVLFLAFFYGVDVGLLQKLKLVALSLPSLFGAATATYNAVSFLLDEMHLPMDGLGIFFETMPLTRGLQTLISLSGMATVSILVTYSTVGRTRFSSTRILKSLIQIGLGILAMVLSLHLLMPALEWEEPVFQRLRIEERASSSILDPIAIDAPARAEERDALMRLRSGGPIRVGFSPRSLPFCYFNAKKELVGFDIALVHKFARSLDCSLEFIPFDYRNLEGHLQKNHFDIACGGIHVTAKRLETMRFSRSYLTQQRCLLVFDYERSAFMDQVQLARRKDLRIAVGAGTALEGEVAHYFPRATIIPVENLQELRDSHADAMFWIVAHATAWALIEPNWTVVIPQPVMGHSHLAFALGSADEELQEIIDYWLELQQDTGLFEELSQLWIMGREPRMEPRWSIMRELLHWVE
ncbi:MAG: cation:dicarboxylase symporter family transporter [Chlamydiia bacterium]|nr:cation:dicarboxylase symporter family transporter [Chlamydiia bacterium]